MSAWETFAWGFLGSASVELVSLLSLYSTRGARLPARYRKVGFWVTRSVLAIFAGLLALAYEIDKRILAFNIGAATPLIVTFMARGLRRPYSPPALGPPSDRASRESTRAAKSDRSPTGSSHGGR